MVEQNLRFFGQSYDLYGARLREQIDFVIEQSDLADHRREMTGALSGGWAQRIDSVQQQEGSARKNGIRCKVEILAYMLPACRQGWRSGGSNTENPIPLTTWLEFPSDALGK